jgi:hypothetical protein
MWRRALSAPILKPENLCRRFAISMRRTRALVVVGVFEFVVDLVSLVENLRHKSGAAGFEFVGGFFDGGGGFAQIN